MASVSEHPCTYSALILPSEVMVTEDKISVARWEGTLPKHSCSPGLPMVAALSAYCLPLPWEVKVSAAWSAIAVSGVALGVQADKPLFFNDRAR
ncbi:unnamed protein product [Rangifer tarandus platyrhynchus]|uniref:Uncharacterized protein n=1 Tax=Rangifer tarandus platyrhynchus TaxID=3082113 RepID=A0ACB1KFR3_RANTA